MNNPSLPSAPRRLIREAVIQLLHSTQSSAEDSDSVWGLILTQQEAKITRSRARAVLHLQQNRASRVQALSDLRKNTPTLLGTFVEESGAARSFYSILKAEEEMSHVFTVLRRHLKSSKEPEIMEESLEKIKEENLNSHEQILKLSSQVGSPSVCAEPLRPLANALLVLQKSVVLLRGIFSNQLPELPELRALVEGLAERDGLKAEIKNLYQIVIDNLAETDEVIAEKVQNFSPERLAQVDRAILRLAVTELCHCPDIPAPVSIDEAIEIARRFGGSDSASFVNGVLGQMKSSEPYSKQEESSLKSRKSQQP